MVVGNIGSDDSRNCVWEVEDEISAAVVGRTYFFVTRVAATDPSP